MKILIIALPRCGSTSLLTKLSDEHNLRSYMEPFSPGNPNPPYNHWDDKDDIIIKTLIGQPKSNDIVSFYAEFSKKFNKVILLSRYDLNAVAESFAYLRWHHDDGFKLNYEYVWEETPNLTKTHKLIQNLSSNLNKLSKEINVPITYYEDIYDVNSKDRLRKTKRVKSLI